MLQRIPCSDCPDRPEGEERPASIALHAIVSDAQVIVRCNPPEHVCLTCHRKKLEAAAEMGLRLETTAILVPVVEIEAAPALAAVGF